MTALRSAWQYRGFIFGNVKRDYYQRYRSSTFGMVWTVLHPAATILIYALVFSQLMRIRLPELDDTFSYSIYICTGIIVWNLFAGITTRCQSVFVDNSELLKKLSFPRVCLPATVVISALIDFAVIMLVFLFFLLLIGRLPGWEILAIIPLLTMHIMFAAALGVILGVLNVFFRDISQVFSIVLQFWFWLSPVVYPIAILPERFAYFISFNPMTGLLANWQNIFVAGKFPVWSELNYFLIWTITLAALALLVYTRWSADMVDEL